MPDSIVYWEQGFFSLNATIVYTWVVMAILVGFSILATRKLSAGPRISRFQAFIEALVSVMRDQIRDVMRRSPDIYLPFTGTLFLFIALSNFLVFIPGYHPPTGSLHTTGALAICVFLAVPTYGISQNGFKEYARHYIQPSPFMLPFNIISELSRTLALAVRLFGNIMSGTMIVAILLSVAPLLVPVVMELLGLLIGQIQAFIFAILATVYIASGVKAHEEGETSEKREENTQDNG